MIKINPLNTTFTFGIIPKNYSVGGIYTLKLRNEQTNTILSTITATNVSNFNDISYLSFNILNGLYEDNFYTADFYLNDVIVYKDRIFATSQTNYTINKDAFSLPTIDNNDYITI